MQFKSCSSVHGAETSPEITASSLFRSIKKKQKTPPKTPLAPDSCSLWPSLRWLVCGQMWGGGGGDKGRVGGVHLTAASWLKTPNYCDEERRNYIP